MKKTKNPRKTAVCGDFSKHYTGGTGYGNSDQKINRN